MTRLEHLRALLGEYRAAMTPDTIAALVAVAEAAEREPRCPFCAAARNAPGVDCEPHLPDCPLAPLVKEADHDRA